MDDLGIQGIKMVAMLLLGLAFFVAILYFWFQKMRLPTKVKRSETHRVSIVGGEARPELNLAEQACNKPTTDIFPSIQRGSQDNSQAAQLLVNFLADLQNLSSQYQQRLNLLKVDPGVSMPQPAVAPTVKSEPIPAPVPTPDLKPLNDMTLIDWWKRHGSKRLSECGHSLKTEFGVVKASVINQNSDDPDDWYLLVVGNTNDEFLVLPRKMGWREEIFGDWFELKEKGVVRGNEIIQSLRPPLTRAVRRDDSWHISNKKCVVSVKDSGGSR